MHSRVSVFVVVEGESLVAMCGTELKERGKEGRMTFGGESIYAADKLCSKTIRQAEAGRQARWQAGRMACWAG